jgi:hypothetical protein
MADTTPLLTATSLYIRTHFLILLDTHALVEAAHENAQKTPTTFLSL